MSETKRYYWLKLRKDFFQDKRVKKLRKIAGGDTYTIIYQKMLLCSIESEGVITYEGVEPTFEEELALTLDEDVDNVKVTVSFLLTNGLMLDIGNNKYSLLEAIESIGSESSSAERVRNFREKQKALQCNTNVTNCNVDVTQVKRLCNVEKEKELEIELELEKDNKTLVEQSSPSVCVLDSFEIEFNKLWSRYPKKDGKAKALEHYRKYRKEGTTYEQVDEGITKYLNYIKTNNITARYIKMGSTWFNQKCWESEYTNDGKKSILDIDLSNIPDKDDDLLPF